MPLRISAWDKWQGQYLKGVRSKRVERGTDAERAYSMRAVAVACSFDDRHAAFARAFRNGEPDAFLLRVLQYVGLHSPFDGCVHVERRAFGPVVLTRSHHVVSVQKGKRVWDALVETGIARVVTPEEAKRLRHVADTSATSHPSRARSGFGSGSGSGNSPPNPPLGDEVQKPARARKARSGQNFDSLDIDTKRAVNIEWANHEAQIKASLDHWRAPAASIRTDIREKRPYRDDRVEKDFALIRSKDPDGLARIVRQVLRKRKSEDIAPELADVVGRVSAAFTAETTEDRIADLETKRQAFIDAGEHDKALLLRQQINRLSGGNGA